MQVDRFGFSRPIVDAYQSQAAIDAGNVVLWNGCWPGQGCPVWLAGHRSSNGSVFADMYTLEPGDVVTVTHDGVTYHFEIYGKQLVERLNPPDDVLQGDLIVQTSWTKGRVWMVYGTHV